MKGALRSFALGVVAMATGFGFVYVTYDYFDAFDRNPMANSQASTKSLQPSTGAARYVVNLTTGISRRRGIPTPWRSTRSTRRR